MTKGDFSNITKKRSKSLEMEAFISGAKVDGTKKKEESTDPLDGLDPQERRGRSYIDKESGQKVKLGGKMQEIPLNAYEVKLLSLGAQKSGLTLTTYIRKVSMDNAKEILDIKV